MSKPKWLQRIMRKFPAIRWSQHPKPKGPRGFRAWNISASPNIQKHLHIKSKWKDPLVIHAPNKLRWGPIGALLKSMVCKQKVLGFYDHHQNGR